MSCRVELCFDATAHVTAEGTLVNSGRTVVVTSEEMQTVLEIACMDERIRRQIANVLHRHPVHY